MMQVDARVSRTILCTGSREQFRTTRQGTVESPSFQITNGFEN